MKTILLAVVVWIGSCVFPVLAEEPWQQCVGGPIEVHMCLEPFITASKEALEGIERAAIRQIRSSDEYGPAFGVDRAELMRSFQASNAAWQTHVENECEARRLAFGIGTGANEASELCYLNKHNERVAELCKIWVQADP